LETNHPEGSNPRFPKIFKPSHRYCYQSSGGLRMRKKLFVLVITLSLLLSGLLAAVGGEAKEEEEKIGVPEWNEGDKWRYSDKVPMPGGDQMIETITEMEVTDENVDINASWATEGEEIYKTYEVSETRNPDAPEEEQSKIDIYYTKDNLAQVYNDPESSVPSAYHPPIVELDFPLYVGKEWSTDSGYDNQYDLARYFEDPPDPEEGKNPEPDREYAFLGRVENKTTKEIELEKGFKVFETYMVNLTVLAHDKETTEIELTRYEMYYSPEVKNLVHIDIFEVRQMPEDQKIGDGFDIRENPIGNKTLVDYNIESTDFGVEITDYDDIVTVGDNTTIEYNISNTAKFEITRDIVFSVKDKEGEEIYNHTEENVTIVPGEDYNGGFSWEPEDEGNYNLTVTSEYYKDTITVTVMEDDDSGFLSNYWWLIILILIAAVIAIGIAIAWSKKKPPRQQQPSQQQQPPQQQSTQQQKPPSQEPPSQEPPSGEWSD